MPQSQPSKLYALLANSTWDGDQFSDKLVILTATLLNLSASCASVDDRVHSFAGFFGEIVLQPQLCHMAKLRSHSNLITSGHDWANATGSIAQRHEQNLCTKCYRAGQCLQIRLHMQQPHMSLNNILQCKNISVPKQSSHSRQALSSARQQAVLS